jgi:hypothetical protein
MAAILALPNTALVGVARLNWSAFLAAQPKAGGILGEILVFFFGFGLRILGKNTMRIFGRLDFPRLLLCSFW